MPLMNFYRKQSGPQGSYFTIGLDITTLGFHAIICNLNLLKLKIIWIEGKIFWKDCLCSKLPSTFPGTKKLRWDLFSFDINSGVNEQHTCRHIPTKVPRKYSLGGTIFTTYFHNSTHSLAALAPHIGRNHTSVGEMSPAFCVLLKIHLT